MNAKNVCNILNNYIDLGPDDIRAIENVYHDFDEDVFKVITDNQELYLVQSDFIGDDGSYQSIAARNGDKIIEKIRLKNEPKPVVADSSTAHTVANDNNWLYAYQSAGSNNLYIVFKVAK